MLELQKEKTAERPDTCSKDSGRPASQRRRQPKIGDDEGQPYMQEYKRLQSDVGESRLAEAEQIEEPHGWIKRRSLDVAAKLIPQ